jgi:hypothetical protein
MLEVCDDELVELSPEPDPPNFERLPSGAKELFEPRLDALPIRRIHSRLGAEANRLNESRALNRYEKENRLVWDEIARLGTWHMRAVHDRISAVRPDLLPPRRPSGSYVRVRAATPAERIQRRLVSWHLWNLLNGTYSWNRNRAIALRAGLLRALAWARI